jgi:hypothetical protein
MGMVALLLLALFPFAALTALVLGLVTVLLVLLLLALTFSLLLVREVWVVALAFDRREFVGLLALVLSFVALATIAAHGFGLELSENSVAYVNELDVVEVALLGDNGNKHLPFLRECGEKHHSFNLLRDVYFRGCKALEASSHFIHSGGRVLVGVKADGQSFLKVFVDGGRRSLTITLFKVFPDAS